jgi:hypothetical protein
MLTKEDLKQISQLLDDKFKANSEILIKKMDDGIEMLARIIHDTVAKEGGELKVLIEKLPTRHELKHSITQELFSRKDDLFALTARVEALEADMKNLKK